MLEDPTVFAALTYDELTPTLEARDLNSREETGTAPYHASLNPATELFEIDALTKTKFVSYSHKALELIPKEKKPKFVALTVDVKDFLDPEFRGAASATGEEGTFLLNPL
ncbi:13365_t:CDS:2 [Entrophospora sp. SA101]|nr:13365_t:CDS:2 [Entrophospora sp. SA101]